MIQFDSKQPYAEIWGQPGLAFQQNGNNFNARGELVTDFSALKSFPEANKDPTPDDGTVPKCYISEEKKEEAKIQNMDTLHWSKLRAMLSIYGEEYKGREQAISFLKGKKS